MNATHERESIGSDDLIARMHAAEGAIDVPAGLDADALAHRAVRRVRARRTGFAVGGSVAAVGVLVAAVALQGAEPWATDSARTAVVHESVAAAPSDATPAPPSDPAPDPAPETQEAPLTYLPVGDGELPELPGVEHGVVETSHDEYTMQGGLVYTLPPGGWTVRGDAFGDPASVAWDRPEDEAESTLTIDVDPDAASWTVPARDSGAWTVAVPGADLVTVVRGTSPTAGLARWETQVRYGGTGWVATLDVPDDEDGDRFARDFLGNLWFEDEGEPEWFAPTYTDVEIGDLTPGVPAGWQTTTTGDLTYAVPAGWTVEEVDGNYGPGVEWSGPLVGGDAGDVRWNMFVELGETGANGHGAVGEEFQPQDLVVPGADFGRVMASQGPHWNDDQTTALDADIALHGADGGQNVQLMVTLPGDDAGLETLRGILGSMEF